MTSHSYLKCILSDGLHHLPERYFGSKGVAMINHRFLISIPTIELNTAAAMTKSSAQHTETERNTQKHTQIKELVLTFKC